MSVVQRTSSQSHLRNMARTCKTEGCTRSVAKDGSLSLCSICYNRVRSAEKKQGKKPKPTVTEFERQTSARDLEIDLPVRRKFEFTGQGLAVDIARMKAEDTNGN